MSFRRECIIAGKRQRQSPTELKRKAVKARRRDGRRTQEERDLMANTAARLHGLISSE